MTNTNQAAHDAAHDEYTNTGFNISLTGNDANSWPRGLHLVSDAARKWDGTTARFALYSDLHGVYSYCTVRLTGRGLRCNPNYRVTVRVDFEGEDARNCEAILILPDGGYFGFEAAQALLA